ncbi:hypothetical protein ACLGIH_03275 [Streptomyces sp. HMX87]|uniref:hypothetical protein n=1 Tax=Streptomyces sp. HMX87 TaxID=3390849 RepID=UPI003A83F6EA
MEDLADEECVLPIFIRCPGHLSGDGKFGQIGDGGELAEDRRPDRAGRRAGSAPGTAGPTWWPWWRTRWWPAAGPSRRLAAVRRGADRAQ